LYVQARLLGLTQRHDFFSPINIFMTTALILRRAFQAVLPATLLLAACGKDDKPAPAAPDQARVLVSHNDANNSARSIKVTVGTTEGPSVNYGANTGYQTVGVGAFDIKTNIAATGGAQINTENKTLAKDKSYSYFVYSGVGQATNTALGVWTEDDLSAPASNTAKIRLVHVGQGIVSPLGLSRPNASGMLDAVVPPTTAGSASAFVSIPTGTASYNLVNSSMNTIVPLAGTAVLSTNFAAGKIYTMVIRGSSNPATANEQFTLDLITNN
jgi:hypothetical protein